MPANISPYLLLSPSLLPLVLSFALALLLAFSPCMYARVYVYIYKKKKEKIPPPPYMREAVNYPPAPTLSFSLSSFSCPPPLLRFARTVIYLPIPFSTYNLHASIVQTDDGNYLRFSANAINQKRRSASPPGPLDRQGYPPPPPCCPCLSRSSFGFRLDSTPSIDNSRLILRESGLLPLTAPGLLRVYGEFRGSR